MALPADTRYVKHIQIQSKRLSDFWGRPVTIGANVLLPEGFDTHPNARYPLVVNHGHFPDDLEASGPSRRIPRSPANTARDSGWTATTGSSRTMPTGSIGTGPGRVSPGAAGRDPASHALLRRFVRGELGQQRTLWRRDHARADPRDRASLPRHRPGLGAVHLWRIHRRVGGDGGAGVLPGRVQRRVGGLPGPDRLPRLHRGRTSTTTRTPISSKARSGGPRDPACGTGAISQPRRSSRSITGSWPWAATAGRGISGISGRRCIPRWARMVTRSRSGTS